MLIPPINFSPVVDNVYRSGHPIQLNYEFLKSLGLKTIVYLGERSDKENAEYYDWAQSQNIKVHCFHVPSVKEPFQLNNKEAFRDSLALILDKRNAPILVHSNKGKHRVGVLFGILRKGLLDWCLAAVYFEYAIFAKGKTDTDFIFIQEFDDTIEVDERYLPAWVRREDQFVRPSNSVPNSVHNLPNSLPDS